LERCTGWRRRHTAVPRHDWVLRRLREGGFEVDSDVFGESADFVAACGTDIVAELQAGRPA